jgi:putative transposase
MLDINTVCVVYGQAARAFANGHLLVDYLPSVSVLKLVNSLEGVSSRRLRSERPDIARCYCWRGALWSLSDFSASCGCTPISVVGEYIEQQATPA